MDQPDDAHGRRSRPDANAIDDALSPTERLERLREGLNRRSHDRPSDRGADRSGRSSRAAALRERLGDPEPSFDQHSDRQRSSPPSTAADERAEVLSFDPATSPDDKAPPQKSPLDEGSVIPAADVESPPAPREKARWRTGTGPRAAAARDASARRRPDDYRVDDLDDAPPARRSPSKNDPYAALTRRPTQPSLDRSAEAGSPNEPQGERSSFKSSGELAGDRAGDRSLEDVRAGLRRNAEPAPETRRGFEESTLRRSDRIDPVEDPVGERRPDVVADRPGDTRLRDAASPSQRSQSPRVPESLGREASAVTSPRDTTPTDDLDAERPSPSRARRARRPIPETSVEPRPATDDPTPPLTKAFKASGEAPAEGRASARVSSPPLSEVNVEPLSDFPDLDIAKRDDRVSEPRAKSAESGGAQSYRDAEPADAPTSPPESTTASVAPAEVETGSPEPQSRRRRPRALSDDIDALLEARRRPETARRPTETPPPAATPTPKPSQRAEPSPVSPELFTEDDFNAIEFEPSAVERSNPQTDQSGERVESADEAPVAAGEHTLADEASDAGVDALDDAPGVSHASRSNLRTDGEPTISEAGWEEDDAFWSEEDAPPASDSRERRLDRQSDIRGSLDDAFDHRDEDGRLDQVVHRDLEDGRADGHVERADSSDLRIDDLRQSDEAIAPLVPIDPLSRDDWEEAHEARQRAFFEAAREVEERRALRSTGSRPFSLEERMLAGRYLRARRKEGFISVIAALSLIGIALGVAILIIVMSVMNGFRAELVSKIVGVNGHLMVMSLTNDFTDYREISERVRAVPGVTRAAPLVEAQAFANAPRNGTGVVVRGVSKEDLLTLEKVSVTPETSFGSLSEFQGDEGVAIGQRLAVKLGLSVGDNLTLISPRGATTPFGVMPRKKSYRILYIFKVGMSTYDEGVVFMPLFEAQKFFNKNGSVDAIEVMVATPERLAGYREDIEAAAGRQIFIADWIESNRSLIGALKTERTVMFLILSFLILIASLIIIAGMIMLVKEKGKDIAILRTMGMSRGAVMRIFFMCGASIGLVGTVAGVALGLLFCSNIDHIADAVSFLANGDVFPEDVYILSKLPAQVHTEDVVMTVGIAIGLSFFATLYPAWRAARLDPVEALRYE